MHKAMFLVASFLVAWFPTFAFSYEKCETGLWRSKNSEPILKRGSDFSVTRETNPGWMCVEFDADLAVKTAHCAVSYFHGPNAGTYNCFLGKKCKFDSRFTDWNDTIEDGKRKICVYLKRTDKYYVLADLVVRTGP